MRGTVRNVWMRVVVVLALASVLVVGMVATVYASPMRGPSQGPRPYPATCQFQHWGIFESAQKTGNGYIVNVYAEGLYDNSSNTFCGGVRGDLQVWIPAFHVGGATNVTFSFNNMHNSGTASSAGSSGYWYELFTSTTYAVECGNATGFFMPSGGSEMFAGTANGCAS